MGEYCAFGWYNHVRGHWRAHDERAYSSRTFHDEDQGRCSSRAQVFGMDWWVYPLISEYFPANVDFQGGVRRVRPNHCAPKVLLIWIYQTIALLSSVLTPFSVLWRGPVLYGDLLALMFTAS